MTDSDGVLAAIDSCLTDYTVSYDAMRWAPDEPDPTVDDVCQPDFRGAEPTYTVVDETHVWTTPDPLYRETFERFIAAANGLDASAGRPFQRHYLNNLVTARFVPSLEDVDAPTRADLDGGMEVGIVNDGLRFAMGGEVSGDGYPRSGEGGYTSSGGPWLTGTLVQPFTDGMNALTADLAEWTQPVGRAFSKFGQAWMDGMHRMEWERADPRAVRKHRRRCRTCNPVGNPLGAFSGNYDYRQRRKSQARRRRR